MLCLCYPATWRHGWIKHGFSRVPSNSNMVIIIILAICYLRVFWWYSAKTMFTPTMLSRGQVMGALRRALAAREDGGDVGEQLLHDWSMYIYIYIHIVLFVFGLCVCYCVCCLYVVCLFCWFLLLVCHTCHILPPSEIDSELCLAVFAGSGENRPKG